MFNNRNFGLLDNLAVTFYFVEMLYVDLEAADAVV